MESIILNLLQHGKQAEKVIQFQAQAISHVKEWMMQNVLWM